MNKNYILLAVLFFVSTVTLGWLIGDMAVHMRTVEADAGICHIGVKAIPVHCKLLDERAYKWK